MLFPTVEFGLFFLAVLAGAWLLASRPRWNRRFLLAASYIFYGLWDWRYVPLLFGVSFLAGWIAQRIQHSDDDVERKRLMVAGVALCLAVLAYYKYTAFLLLSLEQAWGWLSFREPVWRITAPFLPLGISFFVFHAISLIVDVWRRKLRDPLYMEDALLYVAFFPQLIAGPILRASYFIPQVLASRDRRRIRINRAFLLILSGLFKKVVISNALATRLVEPVFAAPQGYHMLDAAFAVYGYAAQIYCDFSGYTDIATGCALLLGFRFPRNFNAPYTAVSPQDFWRRWHITLSTWLRDYLYIPLGGSHKGNRRTQINLMATMLLGGLWHGASWTFVIWGGLHGLYLVVHRLWFRSRLREIAIVKHESWWPLTARVLCFHAVCFAWIFFRAPTFSIAGQLLRQLLSPGKPMLLSVPLVLLVAIGIFGQALPGQLRRLVETTMARVPVAANGAALAVGVYIIELLGPTGVMPFVYFQF